MEGEGRRALFLLNMGSQLYLRFRLLKSECSFKSFCTKWDLVWWRSKKDELLNISYSRAKLEERYERTKQEEKSIIQRIAEQRNNLFLSSMIARKVIKLSQKVIPGTTKSPLSEKYWRNIITQANEVYPSLEKKFSEFNMTLADLRYCYLVLFHLDTITRAVSHPPAISHNITAS